MDEASNDYDLLRQYVEAGSDVAFAQLVSRHTDMVWSAARRQVGPGGLADEVTQAVFILLLRKADRLPPGTVVAAWLFKATRYTSMNALRAQARRRRHERKAAEMAPAHTPNPTWPLVEPMLDEAIARLSAADRNAVVLRFLERRSLAEVGQVLGISEHAAQMRVSRAVEKMRTFFGQRGVTLTAAALVVVVSAHAAEAAPSTLVGSLTAAALRHAGASTAGPAALANATARSMTLQHARCAVAIGVALLGVVCMIAVGMHLAGDLRTPLEPAAQTTDAPKPVSLAGVLRTGLFH